MNSWMGLLERNNKGLENIKIVDLHGQHLRIKDELDQAIEEVMQESHFIRGRHVGQFQENLEKYLDIRNVIPCGNGTDALQVALMALDLPKNTEVIVPTFNYVAGAEVCALLGLKPVFVEVDPKTFTVTADEIRKVLTPKTKVVIAVHLYGQCAEMEPIMELAKENHLYVIEDTAQALGADYKFPDGTTKKAGTIGHIGTTSFFPTKCLGCMGDGGAIFTGNDELAAKMRQVAFHGQVKKYQYEIIGLNSRLDTLQAAILDVKLQYIDDYIKSRNQTADFYNSKFKDHPELEIPLLPSYSTHVYHQYTIKVENRQQFSKKLEDANIPYMIYYPSPLHLERAFSYLGHKDGDFPVSEQLCKQIISLPVHTELTQEEIEYIAKVVVN